MHAQTDAGLPLPSIALAIALRERVLLALAAGPQPLKIVSATARATPKQVKREIDKLHQARIVRRLGSRAAALWCLATWHGRLPPPREKKPRTRTVRLAGPGSWWTDGGQFWQRARQRAHDMGWDQ